jgi:acyl-CoA synthetase (AMP-forming)/AMP-acid ligase II
MVAHRRQRADLKRRHLAPTDRINELLNRGEEKISPEEVAAVLLAYPTVAEAAVFGMPDLKNGEKVSAALVLRSAAIERELKFFNRARLADFKMPEVIHLVSVIPKKAMGRSSVAP